MTSSEIPGQLTIFDVLDEPQPVWQLSVEVPLDFPDKDEMFYRVCQAADTVAERHGVDTFITAKPSTHP